MFYLTFCRCHEWWIISGYCTYLNLLKAYDRVHHGMPLKELLKLFNSYVCARNQYVVYNGSTPVEDQVTFLIVINDLPSCLIFVYFMPFSIFHLWRPSRWCVVFHYGERHGFDSSSTLHHLLPPLPLSAWTYMTPARYWRSRSKISTPPFVGW